MNKLRSFMFAVIAVFTVGTPLSAFAQTLEPQPFTQEAFETAQRASKTVLVEIFTTWCEVCARQKAALEKIRTSGHLNGLVILEVNFDTQRDVARRFGARMQSTLICFRRGREIYRSVGETQAEWLEDGIAKAVYAPPPI